MPGPSGSGYFFWGQEMAEKEPYPTWRYRRTKSGEISGKIFMSDKIPPGYVDSPAKCVEKPKKPKA